MERTQEEIQAKILEICAYLDEDLKWAERESTNAVLDVLENDLDFQQIEDKYFDENKTYTERSALNAREWMDGNLDEIEIW